MFPSHVPRMRFIVGLRGRWAERSTSPYFVSVKTTFPSAVLLVPFNWFCEVAISQIVVVTESPVLVGAAVIKVERSTDSARMLLESAPLLPGFTFGFVRTKLGVLHKPWLGFPVQG